MKFKYPRAMVSGLLCSLACVVAATAPAAETSKPLVAQARTLTPASNKPAVIEPPAPPVSTFAIPLKQIEGRDPFFPNSSRVYGTTSTATNRGPSIVADLVLKGISGTPEQPLAIINTTTLAAGETNEVITKSGRLRIQCVEINMSVGTVLLQIGAERRELKLSPGK